MGLYICLISVHGLIRAEDLELGRDADTGGQVKYVVELARALSEDERVERVDLLTRKVEGPRIDKLYSQKVEKINDKANIIRIPCGSKRYMRKEVLWNTLDSFIDGSVHHFRGIKRLPDVIHAHYADAGYVGAALCALLEVPLVFTGHSLGREKRRRLLENGSAPEVIQAKYNINTRIDGEERALSIAELVVASTEQEVQEQYKQYENYNKKKMEVIPPGVDIDKFMQTFESFGDIEEKITPFLKDKNKKTILAISRADEKKNIKTLVETYGESKKLQKKANLILIMGNREDINELDAGARKVIARVFRLVDRYDLYGHCAYPKHHESEDIPKFYQYAKQSSGVFVNIAHTEPFGLTLIEAAAAGVPVVATNDGGPQDIIKNCQNGILVTPTEKKEIEEALLTLLEDDKKWQQCSESGEKAVAKKYSWKSHVETYLEKIESILPKYKKHNVSLKPLQKFSLMDKLLICDIDNTLLGDKNSLGELVEFIRKKEFNMGFGIATGRHLESAEAVLKEWDVPTPDVMITSVGSEIYYQKKRIQDAGWYKHIDKNWKRDKILDILSEVDGLELQADVNQRDHKISYIVDSSLRNPTRQVRMALRQASIPVNVIFSHNEFLDILPFRASKGQAVRYIALKWGVEFSNILVAGDSGNDEDMLSGASLAIVVGNYSRELEKLKGKADIYFANTSFAAGILEGINYYDFN